MGQITPPVGLQTEPAPLPRRSFLADLRELGADLGFYRELLAELTRRDLRIRYKQAVMGFAWAILTPLVVALSGWVIRLALSYMSGSPLARTELADVAVRSLAWSFFAGALGFGTASITANLPLVTKVYFPRALLPISAVITQAVDTAIAAVALVLILPYFDVHLSWALLWVPLLVLLLILLTTGISLLASCANVFYRDAKHLVQIVVSFGIFFTPVIFDADAFGPNGARWLMLNPLGPIFEGLRLAIVSGHDLTMPLSGARGVLIWSPWYLWYVTAWAVVGTAAAAVLFHRAEFKFAEYV